MILGERCTRGCRFCGITAKTPAPPDPDEPRRVAEAVAQMGTRHVVITSVTRDDLPDGGAAHWAATIHAIRNAAPSARIEVLTPDFLGDPTALDTLLRTRPDTFGHNLETVPRLYPLVRSLKEDRHSCLSSEMPPPTGKNACPPSPSYARSLRVLRQAAAAGLATKTSIMLGLGETMEEVEAVMRDARAAGCTIFYAGQYLQPTPRHAPVMRYVEPAEFDTLRDKALALGFTRVASAPLVRSSLHQEDERGFCTFE
ncbi:MAG: radical SAM protein, partial [Kiritimatiellaeota bacterium]|nr:radical SAM protein [Kiritimatiellota bacterium]